MKGCPAARLALLTVLLVAGLVVGAAQASTPPTATEASAPTATTAQPPADATLVGLPEPALRAATQQVEKVCRGRCTYFTSEHSFTTPCSPTCDCEDSVNGHPLHSFSCGMVEVQPIH